MRLTPDEVAAIKDCAARHFGEGAVVRLFGSRVHDHLRGGDIDLHIVAETSDPPTAARARFIEALQPRLGEDRIDLLVHGPSDRRRPIDDIAILTGRVLAGPTIEDGADLDARSRASMTKDAYRRLVADAVSGGHQTGKRLRETLTELEPKLPFDASVIDRLSPIERFMVDSLLLQYGNMVAIVQDQLVRGLLLVAEGRLETRNREAQRLRAEQLGIIPAGLGFAAMAEARNRVAHHYPDDPAKQALAINEVAAAIPLAIEAFDALAAYAEENVLRVTAAEGT